MRVRILALALFSACSLPSAPPRVEPPPLIEHGLPPAPIDVRHYAIDVALKPAERAIDAATRVDFTARSRIAVIELDLMNSLEVSAVLDSTGKPLAFTHTAARLVITLAKPLEQGADGSVTVHYGGVPRLGLWFTGDDGAGGPTQVFSQGQCDESRGWYPCFDHPSDRVTSEVAVTLPPGWISIAAGERIASEPSAGEGALVERWRMETSHPNYLITLVAGELELVEEAWGDVELWYAADAELAPAMPGVFGETPQMLAFLSDYSGRAYPYSKYSQACVTDFHWGGMENISATTLTDLVLTDERARRDDDATDLIVHEAAHQWFGDLVTCNEWSHAWLHEGFATYFECLWVEATEGEDALRALVRNYQESYLEHAAEELQPTVSAQYREPGDLFDDDIYAGAAVRLHLLRFVLGDKVFKECVQRYVAEFAGSNVETDDFRRVCERVSGRSLGAFFEQWFYRPGFPVFAVDWEWEEGRGVAVQVSQIQERTGGTSEVFALPVDIEVRGAAGAKVHRVEIDERAERFLLPSDEEPLYVAFDRGSWIPKQMVWTRAPAEWIALAEHSRDATARADAARALGALAAEAAQQSPERHETCAAVLCALLERDPSPWVKSEAAAALGRARGQKARESLQAAATGDSEALVRAAALSALCAFGPDPELAALGEQAFEEGYSYATMGAAAALFAAAAPDRAFEWIASRLGRESPHDMLRRLLLEVLGGLEDKRVYNELVRWLADKGTSPQARGAAAEQLAKRREKPVATARLLGELLADSPYRLRTAAIEGLATLGGPAAQRWLREHYAGAQDSIQRRAIEEALAEEP